MSYSFRVKWRFDSAPSASCCLAPTGSTQTYESHLIPCFLVKSIEYSADKTTSLFTQNGYLKQIQKFLEPFEIPFPFYCHSRLRKHRRITCQVIQGRIAALMEQEQETPDRFSLPSFNAAPKRGCFWHLTRIKPAESAPGVFRPSTRRVCNEYNRHACMCNPGSREKTEPLCHELGITIGFAANGHLVVRVGGYTARRQLQS